MRFDTQQHPCSCGIALHARGMYACIVNQEGEILLHRHMKAAPEPCLKAIAPCREGLVGAGECRLTRCWLAALWAQEGMALVLGHALSMKAVHGGKARHDKSDSPKIAALLRGGMRPQAYGYPAAMRATRDLLRRRIHLVRQRAELLARVQQTSSRYDLPEICENTADKANRTGVAERVADPAVQQRIEGD
jgi:Transposase